MFQQSGKTYLLSITQLLGVCTHPNLKSETHNQKIWQIQAELFKNAKRQNFIFYKFGLGLSAESQKLRAPNVVDDPQNDQLGKGP